MEKDLNINIPPFYPGEEIICVDDVGTYGIKKGQQYIADNCSVECNCGPLVYLRGITDNLEDGSVVKTGTKYICASCAGLSKSKSDWSRYKVSRFVSKKSLMAPPMKFTKIEEFEKQKEKPLILIEN